jgi:hypothetical protein
MFQFFEVGPKAMAIPLRCFIESIEDYFLLDDFPWALLLFIPARLAGLGATCGCPGRIIVGPVVAAAHG